MADAGTKYDTGKLRFDLLPPIAMEEVVKVMTMGAEKYGDNNYRGGMEYKRLVAACLRHLHAWRKMENNDTESHLNHIAHSIVNLIFLLEYQLCGLGTDDREEML